MSGNRLAVGGSAVLVDRLAGLIAVKHGCGAALLRDVSRFAAVQHGGGAVVLNDFAGLVALQHRCGTARLHDGSRLAAVEHGHGALLGNDFAGLPANGYRGCSPGLVAEQFAVA